MHADARALIDTRPFYRDGLRALAALLPESEAELNDWIAAAANEKREDDFVFLTCAAAISGRTLQASLLPAGFSLFPDHWRFAWIAWRMQGDVTSEIITALDGDLVPTATSAMALFIATAWWFEHRPGQDLPSVIGRAAKDLSDWPKLNGETKSFLQALAELTADRLGRRVMAGAGGAQLKRLTRRAMEGMFKVLNGPFDNLIPEKKTHQFTGNRTQRRAVEKVGRNENCPCGSGKKYKDCCEKSDQERLRQSSEVAGKTESEVRADPNCDLTKQRLSRMRPLELVKLDPARVPEDLQQDYILRLGVFKKFEKVAEAFEKLGVPPHLQKAWSYSFQFAVPAWRRDIVARLVAAWPEAEKTLGESHHPAIRLVVASDDPAKFLTTLEAEALAALQSGTSEEACRFASGVIMSPYRALGILLARGVLPIIEEKPAADLFEDILGARALLGLSPDDEFADFMEERASQDRTADETAALGEALEKLGAKGAEVRQLKEKLSVLQRDIVLREKRKARLPAVPMQPAMKEAGLKDLRGKVSELKSLLKERSTERITLRRKVEKLQDEMEAIQSTAKENASPDEDEGGEALAVSDHQPVRLIQFPKKFAETLAAFPIHVRRAAINRIGRIASGEANAFMDTVKIYECENVVRVRVAGEYRLLLQLLPDHVNVIDLINRRDLQMRLKTLRASGV